MRFTSRHQLMRFFVLDLLFDGAACGVPCGLPCWKFLAAVLVFKD